MKINSDINHERCGLIMAGGNGSRLLPLTKSVNKHLLPVYDKPMILYPLSTLMVAGIRRIAIITRSADHELFRNLLGDGKKYGIELEYLKQDYARGVPDGYRIASEFIGTQPVAMILGDNIFIGQGLGQTLVQSGHKDGAHIFAFPVKNPQDYGVVELDMQTNRPVSIAEKPKESKSKLAIPGLYFTNNEVVEIAKNIEPSTRGELEITDVLNHYLLDDRLEVTTFRRGVGWMDAGSIESLYSANELVQVLQERQGLKFSCPEEIAWRNGWISDSELIDNSKEYPETVYGKYLRELVQ